MPSTSQAGITQLLMHSPVISSLCFTCRSHRQQSRQRSFHKNWSPCWYTLVRTGPRRSGEVCSTLLYKGFSTVYSSNLLVWPRSLSAVLFGSFSHAAASWGEPTVFLCVLFSNGEVKTLVNQDLPVCGAASSDRGWAPRSF